MALSVDEQVEQLFRQKTIEEIREIEVQARHQVDENKEQLRQIIGGSYRELLSTSDTVIDIHAKSRSIVEHVKGIQERTASLANAAQEGDSPRANGSTSSLYELGVRVKFLLDTPEAVWSCLDGRDFLAGARRYLAAAEVHRVLTSRHSRHHSAAGHFPLLQHQWPLIRKFRGEIQSRTAAWLRSEEGLLAGIGAVCGALCALALLKPLDGEELLKAFLATRQEAMERRLLALASSDGSVYSETIRQVAKLATNVADTVAMAAQLFCRLPGVTSAPLLQEALREDGDNDELSSAVVGSNMKAESQAWRSHVEATLGRLSSLGSSGVALELGAWLDGVAASWAGGVYLDATCSAADLQELEKVVCERMGSWRCDIIVKGDDTADGSSGSPEDFSLAWEDVSQWALGSPRPLWPLLLETPFLERAKAIVDRQLQSTVYQVSSLIDSALEQVVRSFDDATLGDGENDKPDAKLWSQSIDLRPRGTRSGIWQTAGAEAARVFDQGLEQACNSARGLASNTGREAALEPHVRLHLGQTARDVATAVEKRLETVLMIRTGDHHGEGVDAGDGKQELFSSAANSSRALVIGHVAIGLARGSAVLSSGSTTFVGEYAALRAVRQPLVDTATRAFEAWAEKTAANIAERCALELGSDAALTAPNRLRAWRPVQLDDDGEMGNNSSASSSFALPFAPSPAVMAALLAAAREADRAGLASAGPDARRVFESALSEALLEQLSDLVVVLFSTDADVVTTVSEPGALQLAFDARTIAVALGVPKKRRSGGAGHPSGNARVQEWASLESRIVRRLDPIDWATAAPYLDTLVPDCLARSKLLLGALSGVAALSSPGPSSVGLGAEATVMRAAPAVARCALLPVATPGPVWKSSPSATNPQQHRVPSLLLELEPDGGEAAHYSFANLSERARERAKIRAASSDRGSVTEFVFGSQVATNSQGSAARDMGVAAIEALRGSKLGTLLGDRAAEMMGDMSFGGSLFSSFTGGLRR